MLLVCDEDSMARGSCRVAVVRRLWDTFVPRLASRLKWKGNLSWTLLQHIKTTLPGPPTPVWTTS